MHTVCIMRIGDREIGPNHPPYVIAEIGVNHDGSVERALALARMARDAGADAVKLQLFKTDLLLSRSAKLAAYQESAGETDPIGMLRRLELSVEQMTPVVGVIHELRLHAIVTVFSVELVGEARGLGWDAYKTASPDIINRPLLDEIATTGGPMIVSTGASTLAEVERAVGWLKRAGERVALLQCVSCYPTPIEHASLGGIAAIGEVFAGPVGYSDHTAGVETGAMAVAAGACVLEKHLTYDRSAAGPDHAASLDVDGFGRYVELARSGVRADDSLEPLKRVLDIERDVRSVSRQSLIPRHSFPAGHVLTRDDLTIKRPGIGLEPCELEGVVGRALARDVEADVPLTRGDLQTGPADRDAR